MIKKYLALILFCFCISTYSQNHSATIKLENSIFEPLAKNIKTFDGVLGGCNTDMQGALFTLNHTSNVKEITLLGVKALKNDFVAKKIIINIDNLGDRSVVIASRPIETINGTFLITAQSDGQLYISKININKNTLSQTTPISKFRLGFAHSLEVVSDQNGIWIFSGQDSDVQIDLVSFDFKLIESKIIKTSGEISKIEATASFGGVFISAHAGGQYDFYKITYANNKINTKPDGKRPYDRLVLDRNFNTGEFIGLHVFSIVDVPIGGLKIMYGQFGKSSIFGNNDIALIKQSFSYPSLGFGRLDEKNVAIGIVAATKWIVYRAPLDASLKSVPTYSTYKYWIDASAEAPRPTFDVQLFCPLNKDEFMGINTVEKKEQRGLFVGRFR